MPENLLMNQEIVESLLLCGSSAQHLPSKEAENAENYGPRDS